MSFIPTVWDSTEEALAFKRDRARAVYVEVGYEDDGSATYFLNVELFPSQEGNEFTFALIRGGQGILEPLYDSSVTGQIVNSPTYKAILRRILMRMAEDLVRSCNFENFFMVTFCQHLPPQALTKYQELCEIFQKCGYDVEGPDEIDGRYLWIMNQK